MYKIQTYFNDSCSKSFLNGNKKTKILVSRIWCPKQTFVLALLNNFWQQTTTTTFWQPKQQLPKHAKTMCGQTTRSCQNNNYLVFLCFLEFRFTLVVLATSGCCLAVKIVGGSSPRSCGPCSVRRRPPPGQSAVWQTMELAMPNKSDVNKYTSRESHRWYLLTVSPNLGLPFCH